MKKILTILFVLMTSVCVHAEDYPIVDVIYYDATSEAPLEYSHTFAGDGYTNVTTSLPIAEHLYISGLHLEFSISHEMVMWYMFRDPSATYFDLYLNFYKENMLYGSQTKLLRIYINR